MFLGSKPSPYAPGVPRLPGCEMFVHFLSELQDQTKDKKVSQKELDEIMAKKRKERGAESGGGNVSIKVQMN